MKWLGVTLFLLLASVAIADTLNVPNDHLTIQAAIDSAEPGDVILVEPGTYHERIHLAEKLTLRSAGDQTPGDKGLKRAEVTILDGGGEKTDSAGVSLAQGSVLDGFTVTHVGQFNEEEFQKHHATRGEHLPDSRGAVGAGGGISAIDLSAVTATVLHCIVRDNGHGGIGCAAKPGQPNRSRIEGNVVYQNMGGGIGIALGADPLVKGNHCFRNLRAGIGCRAAKGLITQNYSYQNVRAGIGIREGARPIVRGNYCYENQRAGIGNRMAGTSPLIEKNECYRNGMSGIGTRNEASPLISQNHCYENRLAGIGAMADARPTIIQNRIHSNGAAGIGLEACERGIAILIDNQIEAKDLVAIGIQKGWHVRASGNKLKRVGGMPPLVMVLSGAEADFTGNHFEGSGVAAIRVAGQVRVLGNTFTCPKPRNVGPPQFAVWALKQSEVLFGEGNKIEGWRKDLSSDVGASVRRVANWKNER